MTRRALRAAALALALAPATVEAQGDTLTVATYAYRGVDRAGAVAPLAAYLGRALGRPVRVRVHDDPTALARATREGAVDVVVTNTFGYLLLADGPAPAATAVATFRLPPGISSNYGSVIVGRAGVADSLGALRAAGRTLRVGLVQPGSTTGNLVPRLRLAALGVADLDATVARVTYAGTHAAAGDLLRRGEADVVALASEEWDRQAAADTAAGRWRELWRSPDIRLGPVAVRRSLPDTLRARVAALVAGLERHDAAAFAALRGGWVEARRADALAPAADATYDDVRALFGEPAAAHALIARFAR